MKKHIAAQFSNFWGTVIGTYQLLDEKGKCVAEVGFEDFFMARTNAGESVPKDKVKELEKWAELKQIDFIADELRKED